MGGTRTHQRVYAEARHRQQLDVPPQQQEPGAQAEQQATQQVPGEEALPLTQPEQEAQDHTGACMPGAVCRTSRKFRLAR